MPSNTTDDSGSSVNGRTFGFHPMLALVDAVRPVQDQPEHLLEDQMQKPQRHGGDHARSPGASGHRWSAACTASFGTANAQSCRAVADQVPGSAVTGWA